MHDRLSENRQPRITAAQSVTPPAGVCDVHVSGIHLIEHPAVDYAPTRRLQDAAPQALQFDDL